MSSSPICSRTRGCSSTSIRLLLTYLQSCLQAESLTASDAQGAARGARWWRNQTSAGHIAFRRWLSSSARRTRQQRRTLLSVTQISTVFANGRSAEQRKFLNCACCSFNIRFRHQIPSPATPPMTLLPLSKAHKVNAASVLTPCRARCSSLLDLRTMECADLKVRARATALERSARAQPSCRRFGSSSWLAH